MTGQQKYNIIALKLLNKILVYNLYYFPTRFVGESSYQIRTHVHQYSEGKD
jgi:hypothetical protein